VLVPEEEFTFATGQFIEVALNGIGEAPYTPSSSPYIKDKLEVTVMKAGYVTGKMHQLKPGEIVGIRGPYGRGYPLEEFYDKEVLILGGGVGLAPLRSLLYTLIEEKDKFKRLILCYGAKTPEDIIYKGLFPGLAKVKELEVLRSVDQADKGWKETEGVVTVLLDKIKVDVKNSVGIVCGPPVMMKFGTFKLMELGYKEENIYLSMEKNMSCGVGKCGHCQLGDYFVCKDGPVFKYSEVKNYPDIWS
jgi:NAD(P)H-flavin reductase